MPADGPVEVYRKSVRDESRDPEKWRNDPMASQRVEENITSSNQYNGTSIEPEEHPRVVRRPEVVPDPLNESSVQDRFVEDVDDICGEERPKKNAKKHHYVEPQLYLSVLSCFADTCLMMS